MAQDSDDAAIEQVMWLSAIHADVGRVSRSWPMWV
jgi:hypothetical protein